MQTLIDYFNNDFKDLSFDSNLIIQELNKIGSTIATDNIIVKSRVRIDQNSSCRLFTYYLSSRSDTLSIMKLIIDKINELKKDMDEFESIGSYDNDVNVGTHKSVYSNRLFFYTETQLTTDEISILDKYCKERNLFVTNRSSNYIKSRMKNEIPLAFISHDSRDKDIIAKPIVYGLSSRLCSVWYDEYSLKPGQSLRESIEDGIKNAKKCILILTPHFLNNSGWTKKEFNSIFTREMIFNERVVIPIWHNIRKEEVYKYSPSLADTVALIWPDQNKLVKEEYDKEVEKIISKVHTAVTE